MIHTTDDGPVRVLTIDRPEKANSLTSEMLETLRDGVRTALAQVLILTGSGRTFSAGADLDEARAGLATSPLWEELSGAVAAFDGLTIAALNGTLAGGAFGMALACDLRIAAPQARFFYPVMRLGFLPQPSDPVRLAALIGPARAKLILIGGEKLTAAQALSFGLIDEMADDPIGRAHALAGDAGKADAGHVAAIKHMIPSSV